MGFDIITILQILSQISKTDIVIEKHPNNFMMSLN
jgi:hypothetical protein